MEKQTDIEKLTITLKLPDGVKDWLAAEGNPIYRSAAEQAAFLCAKYLIRTYKSWQH